MRYLISSLLALSCAVCAADRPVTGSDTPGALIARMVSRRAVLMVRAGADGATYSLQTKGGEVVLPAAKRSMQAVGDWAGIDTDTVP